MSSLRDKIAEEVDDYRVGKNGRTADETADAILALISDLPATDAQALANPKVKALVGAAEKTLNPEGRSRLYRHLVERKLRTALAAIKEMDDEKSA